jgi:uncharacterized protein YraI
VVDSNSQWDEWVRVHDWTPRPAPGLKLYAYRMPTGTAALAVTASSAAAATDTRLVATDGDCLHLRTGPGLGGRILACLPDRTAVPDTGAGTPADGYQWLPVTTNAGTGWVASEYLASPP